MPALTESHTRLDLDNAKPKGLSLTQLGIPLQESTQIKKGKQHEFIQPLEDGRPGRRFQNLRATAVKTVEGGVESAKLFLQFEVFGDDNVPLATNSGFSLSLLGTDGELLTLPATPLFLPYACAWYDNHFVYDIPTAVFDAAGALQLTALADQVRTL